MAQFENSDIHEFDVKMELSPSPRNFQGFGSWKNVKIPECDSCDLVNIQEIKIQNTNPVISCFKIQIRRRAQWEAAKSVLKKPDILCDC